MEQPVYDEEYLCYFKNKYIGTATFTYDPYLGDSFILWEVSKSGKIYKIALMPDRWILKAETD